MIFSARLGAANTHECVAAVYARAVAGLRIAILAIRAAELTPSAIVRISPSTFLRQAWTQINPQRFDAVLA
jgi:hypothetical protein